MTTESVFTAAYLALVALVLGGWLWSKLRGVKVDNSEAWEKKYPKRTELRSLPYRFRWWHVPVFLGQAAFIGWWVYEAHKAGENVVLIFFLAVVLCAFLTACITQGWDWIVRRLRGLRGHRGQASGHSLSTARPRSLLGEAPEKRKRVGIGD